MITGKRRFFAKVVSIIMLSSTMITSDGSVLALEAGEAQEIAINQENEKTENVIVADLEDNFVTDSSCSNETEVSYGITQMDFPQKLTYSRIVRRY